ncbi:MAG: 30S ribosomal protein S20 [bacterium]|nr:30S ribosomal protein S20 [bacterium]
MAITSSAKRAIGVAERRRVFNLRRKDIYKGVLKALKKQMSAGDKKGANEALSKVFKSLDKMAKTKLIKKGNASRHKSRLAKQIAKLK